MNNPDWNLIAFLVFIAVILVASLRSMDKTSESTSRDLKNALDTLKALQEKELNK